MVFVQETTFFKTLILNWTKTIYMWLPYNDLQDDYNEWKLFTELAEIMIERTELSKRSEIIITLLSVLNNTLYMIKGAK